MEFSEYLEHVRRIEKYNDRLRQHWEVYLVDDNRNILDVANCTLYKEESLDNYDNRFNINNEEEVEIFYMLKNIGIEQRIEEIKEQQEREYKEEKRRIRMQLEEEEKQRVDLANEELDRRTDNVRAATMLAYLLMD